VLSCSCSDGSRNEPNTTARRATAIDALRSLPRVVHCKRAVYDVYVGRPSKWGNPFTIGRDGTLRKSKTDQEGERREVAIPRGGALCPVHAVETWIDAAALGSGLLFRAIDRHGTVATEPLAADSIARLIKKAARRAALDETQYAGHSLRAGHVTQAYLGGVREHTIMQQTGHRSSAVLRRYIRDADLYRDNSAAALGL